MKKLLSFFAALLFAGSMVAETVTLTMSDFQATEFTDNSGISVVTAKEGGTTAPAYNDKAGDLRVYAKGTVTISAPQNISAIEFVISSKGKYRLADLTSNVGEMSVKGDPDWEAKWSGSAKEVTITVGEKATYGSDGAEKAGQLCFDAINVTLENGDTPEPPQPSLKDGFYLSGTFNDWAVSEDYMFIENPATPGEYMIDVTLAEGDELKGVIVVSGAEQWVGNPKDNDNNFKVDAEHAGDVTIYLNPAGNAAWEWTFIYIEVKETPPTPQPQGGEITIIPGDVTDIESGTTGDFEKAINGVTVAWSGAYYNADNGVDFRVYANKTLTLTAEVNILKVEVLGYAKKGLELVVDNGTITTGASYESETTKSDWEDPLFVVEEINAKSITFTCNKQVRFAAIRLTLEGGDDPEQVDPGYYLVGTFNDWTPSTAYLFSYLKDDEKGVTYAISLPLESGAELKAVYVDGDGVWTWIPDGDNMVITEGKEAATVCVFVPNDGAPAELYIDDGEQPSLEDGYYLVANTSEWLPYAMFTLNKEAEVEEYFLDIELDWSEAIKVVKVEKDAIVAWYPEGEGNEWTITEEEQGEMRIYFRPQGNNDWADRGGFIYIEVKAEPQPQGDELWVETFDKNGTYVAKKNGTYWPYANEWFTGYPVSETENVEGNQYTNDYSSVESNGVSIRSKKINGGDAVPGLYFAMNKEAAKNYVKFIGEPLFDASNKDYEYTLNFTICLPESADGGDLQEMNIYMNGLGLALLPKDTKLGDKLVTTDVAVPLENMKINDLQFDFDNTATQKFISKIWITAEKTGDTPQPQLEDGFYLVGDFTEWALDEKGDYKLEANPNAEGEYMLEMFLVKGEQFKAVEVKDDEIVRWYPEGEGNNITFDAAEEAAVVIYFRPAGNTDWELDPFYIEVKETPEPPQPQGGEITITPADVTDIESGTTGDFEKAINGVTVAWSGAYYNADNGVDFRVYANKTLTLTAEVNILKVEVLGYAKKGLELVVDNGTITTGASYESETTKSDWEDPLFVVEEINAKSITFTCNKQVRFAAIRLTLEGSIEPEVLADGFYLAGDFNNWTPTANDIFFQNEEVVTLVEYMKHAYLTEGEGIKVVEYKNGEAANWYPDGMGNEYKVDAAHAGEVDIYFRTEYQDDWAEFGGYMYITEGQSTIITLDVEYGSAVYVNDDELGNFWQLNLYKDYDSETQSVTYPDFYVGVTPKSATAIAGTYAVSDMYFIEVDLDESTIIEGISASDLVVTHIEDNVYYFEMDFIGEDGNTYMLNAKVPVEAYDYASGEEIELVEDDTPVVLADGYYLAGDFNKWEVSADYMFKANPEAEGEYMLDVTLAEGDELKGVIVAFGQIVQWVGNPKDGGNNFKVDAEHAGDVTIYLNPAGRSDWEWTYIYIEVHAQPEYLTCADVLEIAATMEDPTADNKYVYGEEVVVRAYVQFAYDPKEQQASPARKALQQSVWLNDDKAATKGQIQVYYGAVEEVLAKGDFVEAKGQVVKYFKAEGNIIVELLNGEMKKITDTPTGVDNVEASVEVLKTIQNGQFIIIRNGQSFNATGARIQ